jgi:SAM-dependent methyltransferase
MTIELAEAVAPGKVVGIDFDAPAIEQARKNAADKGVENVFFEAQDASALEIRDDSFDAACASSVFQWLKQPGAAAREVWRVLRPGGVFAARDRARDGDLFGNLNPTLRRALRLYDRFSLHRGANHRFGSRVYSTFLRAGFTDVVTIASYDPPGRDPVYFYSPFIDAVQAQAIIELGWATSEELSRFTEVWKKWSADPESFMLIARCGAVGWKPAGA